ncbi:MAG: hypothetical protein WC510_05365 [Candidatus Omnitrophota bacterium]
MRDLLFKNLTSEDKHKKLIASCEVQEQNGVHTVIRRHFITLIKEVKDSGNLQRPLPYIYVLKEHNSVEQKERFFCRIKGGLYAMVGGHLFLVRFVHSLKIVLAAVPQDSIGYK